MRRRVTPEMMDSPGVERVQLEAALGYIRWVNRWMGGTRGLIRHLVKWSRRWPRDRAVTLLDVATGSADVPIAARAWACRRGFDLRITAVDLHEKTLEVAKERVRASGQDDGIEVLRADALDLVSLFGPGSFDYVHAGMFLHHLSDLRALTMLRIMDRVARRGLVWNDLVRSRLYRGLLNVILVGQPEMVRHDARVSVEAGFTRREVLDMASRLELKYARYGRVLGYRFTLAGEKPGAW
jgi:hypothetical protein